MWRSEQMCFALLSYRGPSARVEESVTAFTEALTAEISDIAPVVFSESDSLLAEKKQMMQTFVQHIGKILKFFDAEPPDLDNVKRIEFLALNRNYPEKFGGANAKLQQGERDSKMVKFFRKFVSI